MLRSSFDWVQDASNLDVLFKCLFLEQLRTSLKIQLIEKYVVNEDLKEKMIKALKNGGSYPYTLLKGTSFPQMTVEENVKVLGRFTRSLSENSKG